VTTTLRGKMLYNFCVHTIMQFVMIDFGELLETSLGHNMTFERLTGVNASAHGVPGGACLGMIADPSKKSFFIIDYIGAVLTMIHFVLMSLIRIRRSQESRRADVAWRRSEFELRGNILRIISPNSTPTNAEANALIGIVENAENFSSLPRRDQVAVRRTMGSLTLRQKGRSSDSDKDSVTSFAC